MLGNLGFLCFSSPSFSGLMLFCSLSKNNNNQTACFRRVTKRAGREMQREAVPHLDLGKEVDPDPLGLQAARLFDPHPKVLHVCIDDILHCSAKSKRIKGNQENVLDSKSKSRAASSDNKKNTRDERKKDERL